MGVSILSPNAGYSTIWDTPCRPVNRAPRVQVHLPAVENVNSSGSAGLVNIYSVVGMVSRPGRKDYCGVLTLLKLTPPYGEGQPSKCLDRKI